MPNISDARILMIATDGYEDSELLETRRLLEARGADVTLASLEKGEIKGDKGATAEVDATSDEVDAGDFDALVLPGGVANPDKRRMNDKVVETVRSFARSGRPVAAQKKTAGPKTRRCKFALVDDQKSSVTPAKM